MFTELDYTFLAFSLLTFLAFLVTARKAYEERGNTQFKSQPRAKYQRER